MGDVQDKDYITQRREQEEDSVARKLDRIVASQGRVESSLAQLLKNTEQIIMGQATLADLDAEIQGDLTTAATSIISLLTIVEGKIANGQDFSVEIANIKTVAANLKAAVTGATALTVSATTASLSLAGVDTANITATEPAYIGAFSAVSADTTIATVSPASGNGPSATFTITGVAVGQTQVTISDGNTPPGQAVITVAVAA